MTQDVHDEGTVVFGHFDGSAIDYFGWRATMREEDGQPRIDIRAPIPEDLADITIERFTPTFVLIEDGKEYGRIRGYPGDQFFWFRIDELLSKLPKSVQPPVSKS